MENEATANVETVRVEADVAHVQALNHTEQFDVAEYVVVRRDTLFPLQLLSKAAVQVERALLTHSSGTRCESMQYQKEQALRLNWLSP